MNNGANNTRSGVRETTESPLECKPPRKPERCLTLKALELLKGWNTRSALPLVYT